MRLVRPLHGAVIALSVGSLLLGIVYLTTGGAGGLSLGVLFLLGSACLHLMYRIQRELHEVKALLAVMAYRIPPQERGADRALDEPPRYAHEGG